MKACDARVDIETILRASRAHGDWGRNWRMIPLNVQGVPTGAIRLQIHERPPKRAVRPRVQNAHLHRNSGSRIVCEAEVGWILTDAGRKRNADADRLEPPRVPGTVQRVARLEDRERLVSS